MSDVSNEQKDVYDEMNHKKILRWLESLKKSTDKLELMVNSHRRTVVNTLSAMGSNPVPSNRDRRMRLLSVFAEIEATLSVIEETQYSENLYM